MQATKLINNFIFKEHIIQLKKTKKSDNQNQLIIQIADLGMVPTVERRQRSTSEKEAERVEIEVEVEISGGLTWRRVEGGGVATEGEGKERRTKREETMMERSRR